MRFQSPLSLEEVTSILSYQVQPDPWHRRINIFKRPTSPVCGRFAPEFFSLKSSKDAYSKCMVGKLFKEGSGTILEATWKSSFLSKIWGFHKANEKTVTDFLKEWCQFERIA